MPLKVIFYKKNINANSFNETEESQTEYKETFTCWGSVKKRNPYKMDYGATVDGAMELTIDYMSNKPSIDNVAKNCSLYGVEIESQYFNITKVDLWPLDKRTISKVLINIIPAGVASI